MNISDNNFEITWTIKPSNIQGVGAFTKKRIEKLEKIATGITFSLGIVPIVTFFGGKINHSYKPTCILRLDTRENIYNVYALQTFEKDTEITIDYNDTPFFINKPESHYK